MANTIKLTGTLLSVSALAFGISSIGEEVYRGEIDGYEVVYSEGLFSFLAQEIEDNFIRNEMVVKRGDVEYNFRDTHRETDIDWQNLVKPDFEIDGLEEVTVRVGDKEFNYTGPPRVKGENLTLKDLKGVESFEKANKLYNDLRAKIRGKLRKRFNSEHQKALDSFK